MLRGRRRRRHIGALLCLLLLLGVGLVGVILRAPQRSWPDTLFTPSQRPAMADSKSKFKRIETRPPTDVAAPAAPPLMSKPANVAVSRRGAGPRRRAVEIWGKAAIADYFWEHVLGEGREARANGLWFLGKGECGNGLDLTFRTGYGVQQDHVPQDAEYVVLVLNAHNPEKIPTAEAWIKHLYTLPRLKSAGIVLLGEESCENSWLKKHLARLASKIGFVFLVYGGPLVASDARVHPWPLGVATYRHFPAQLPMAPDGTAVRRHLCNFMGTVYRASSRETLLRILDNLPPALRSRCIITARREWQPRETDATAAAYRNTLLESDLTLAPAGLNTECYRWYEAAAAGSVPVVEDVVKPDSCGQGSLPLLKEEGAPFIFVKDWSELPALLAAEAVLAPQAKANRRLQLIQWYATFKGRMRERFCRVAGEAFGRDSL